MSLPDLIEIVPLAGAVRAEVTVPGSKSITNRALVLAALGRGQTTLHGALWSEDTQVMVECLHTLGFQVNVAPDPREACNRVISVVGLGGNIPRGGTVEKPLEMFVGNAGTAARFLSAMVCLGRGVCRLSGVPRMHERPQASLFNALRELGYRIDSANDKLPALIHGGGPRPGKCRVSNEASTQFASALLLSAQAGAWEVQILDSGGEDSPYVSLTTQLMRAFPFGGGSFQIEPDCSSGSYFWAAGTLEEAGGALTANRAFTIQVAHWPNSGWQVDQHFRLHWSRLEARSQRLARELRNANESKLCAPISNPAVISRLQDLGDSIMTAIVMAPLLSEPVTFTDLGRLRVQECERVAALRTELVKCGARVVEAGDALTVYPSTLRGAEIETYQDHRMAMCFAILGLKIPGLRLQNPACAKKTFPNFFQKLATPPPAGLGASLLDARTGRALRPEELFAE